MNALERYAREHGAFFTADSLMDTEFPEPKWAVHGLLAEGLTLLAGAPKLGKSWMALGLGITIATGGNALGKIPTDEGDVLYAALEDTPRRLQNRMTKMIDGPAPARLTLVTALPEMPLAIDLVAGWLQDHPAARLVVIDVLGKIRPPQGSTADRYEQDYRVISALKRLADNYQVAIVVVTHVRKMADGDVFNTVSGSTGLTGAADTTLVLKRSRNEASGELHITGRDVEESEYAVTFNPQNGAWSIDGESLVDAARRAAETRTTAGLSDKSAEVFAVVNRHPEGVRSKAVSEQVDGLDDVQARVYLGRLFKSERIARLEPGLYAPVTPVTGVTPPDAARNTCNRCNTPIDPVSGTVHPLCAEEWHAEAVAAGVIEPGGEAA